MQLRQNILATLAYYDVLDMPLKAEEILARLINFKHLYGYKLPASSKLQRGEQTTNYKLEEIIKELDKLVLDGVTNRMGEYYFLFDREYLVPLRFKHEKIAKYKWRKAERAIRWLQFVPYLRAVFASGSLAMNNTDELSDLDVLIVIRNGRIWLARFLITVVLSLFRIRRRASDRIAPDKICPNHYITDKSLFILFKSIYTAQTYASLAPMYIYSPDLIEDFKKSNAWVSGYVFNWNLGRSEENQQLRDPASKLLVRLVEHLLDSSRLGNFLEKIARKTQKERIASNPVTKQSGGRVVFNDEQLEFHPRSIETSIIRKYNDNLLKLGLADFAIERDSGLTV
mgnify:FL=1